MFANASLARRIERAETGLILEGAAAAARRLPREQRVVLEASGGAAVYVEPDCPFNKIVGLGFDGVPPADVLDQIETRFAERQAPVQAEIATLANPEVGKTFTRRGYELVGFENVLGLTIDAERVARLEREPQGIDVLPVTDEDAPDWLETVIQGFLAPDTYDGPASHEQVSREVLERIFSDTTAAPGFERYLARRGGVIAGGASFRIQEGVAQLSGAATLPLHRRLGVQTAMLRHRLLEAARRGCDIAVVTTSPGSKSQENVQRAGFALLYARAILVKAPR